MGGDTRSEGKCEKKIYIYMYFLHPALKDDARFKGSHNDKWVSYHHTNPETILLSL